MNKILIAIYYHPEAYPPTLNTVQELSKVVDQVLLLNRPHLDQKWIYPTNVKLIATDRKIDIDKQIQASLLQKILFFFRFTFSLHRIVQLERPKIILLYDSFPLFSYYIIRYFIRSSPIIWYHNHDVSETANVRKLSIGWWASKFEKKTFPYIDLFTIPAKERLAYFPMTQLKGRSIHLPNLPGKYFYKHMPKEQKKAKEPLKLLYQGTISTEHGLQEMISFMGTLDAQQQRIELHIVGRGSDSFITQLKMLAKDKGIGSSVFFHGLVPYANLPSITSSCHIGIAVNNSSGLMYKTGGTASNKIYEYAACGLPILYYDNEHYRKYLDQYTWAFPTNLSIESIGDILEEIDQNYYQLSEAARKDFMTTLNFEKHFKPVADYLSQQLQEKD